MQVSSCDGTGELFLLSSPLWAPESQAPHGYVFCHGNFGDTQYWIIFNIGVPMVKTAIQQLLLDQHICTDGWVPQVKDIPNCSPKPLVAETGRREKNAFSQNDGENMHGSNIA